MQLSNKQIGDVELRYIDGILDEVVLMKNGNCVFHLEYMDDGHVWMGIDDVHVNLYSEASIIPKVDDECWPGEEDAKKANG